MTDALELAISLVKLFEGCRLTAYPDPIWNGIPRTPGNSAAWGRPWTIGYGETLGITEGMVWTQEQADTALRARVTYFLLQTLKRCPQLHLEPPARIAACTSLTYNIGEGSFSASSVRTRTTRREYVPAGDAFGLWNKAGGKVMRGLVTRRQRERSTYLGD